MIMHKLESIIAPHFSTIHDWIRQQSDRLPHLFYSSVDLRESSFKIASVDTNVFPAGFNNLSLDTKSAISSAIQSYFNTHFPHAKRILLFTEDHTRNTFYLENVYQIAQRLTCAGFTVTIGSFFNEHPTICESSGFLTLQTANNHTLTIYCLNYLLDKAKDTTFDVCVLNNDLSDGKFQRLSELNIPIVPDPKMGWHLRKKSNHFHHLNQTIHEMTVACHLDLDPWLLSTLFTHVPNIDINLESDRARLAESAHDLFKTLTIKYAEHGITESPYLVIKSNNGTYGMGVLRVSHPDDILTLNRKGRNKMSKGKSSLPIQDILIQEGIPSTKRVDNHASEEVIYQINGQPIGGFYRSHHQKSDTDILNSTGMQFTPFSSTQPSDRHGISPLSLMVAQMANLSAQQEVAAL